MAILALSVNLADMKERMSKIVVASDKNGHPVTADDVGKLDLIALLTWILSYARCYRRYGSFNEGHDKTESYADNRRKSCLCSWWTIC